MIEIKDTELQTQRPEHYFFYTKPAILLLFIVVFLLIKILSVSLLPNKSAIASDLTIENILNSVNKERGLRNLITLNTNLMLSSAAQSKADDMQARHYFSHVDPDGNYIWGKIVAAGYTPYLQLGENLAIEFDSTDSLMAAWMNSPTHRANILNDGFKDQGMGLTFGNPSNGQYQSAIANTFGTLIAIKAVNAPAPVPASPPTVAAANTPPAPKPKPTPLPKPKPTPTPVLEIAKSAPVTAPAPVANSQTLNPRGYALTNASPGLAADNPTSSPVLFASTTPSGSAVINTAIGFAPKNNDFSRYFTLAFGIILLLFLLADLRSIVESKIEHLDKKISNIVLLIISLIVIAILYWL